MNIDDLIEERTRALVSEFDIIGNEDCPVNTEAARAQTFVLETVNAVLRSVKEDALDRLNNMVRSNEDGNIYVEKGS